MAGKYLKPSVLELGGNDPFILLDHADTEKMAFSAMSCRISNGGQRCNASKRFIILEQYYDAFVEAMAQYMQGLTIGDPFDDTTQLPPLARTDLVATVHDQVQRTVTEGAKLVTG